MKKTIILAAGEGKRLHPYTLDCPKCLVKINKKSLLFYQLDVLKSKQINQIILITGYQAEKLQIKGLTTYFNKDFADTNMVWTLFCAEQEMTEELIVSYGDIAYSQDVLNILIQSPYDISVVIDKDWEAYWSLRCADPLTDAETLKIDQEGKISEIGQQPQSIAEIEGQYIGLMKFTEAGLNILKNKFTAAKVSGYIGTIPVKKAYMTDLLQAVINDGHAVWPVFIHGNWVEIDTVKDLKLEITQSRLKKIAKINSGMIKP